MKYYAVKKGRNPGIYTSRDACLKEVHKYKGAIYKSFKTRQEAENFLKEEKIQVKADKDSVIAYVDGSFNLEKKIYGAGVVYITDQGEEEFYKVYDDAYHVHRNVAGEVKASELAIKKAIQDGKKQIYIHHDYQGIASRAQNERKANNDLTLSYKNFIEEAKKQITIHFIKVKGHSNDPYNDKADTLAKKACGIV